MDRIILNKRVAMSIELEWWTEPFVVVALWIHVHIACESKAIMSKLALRV